MKTKTKSEKSGMIEHLAGKLRKIKRRSLPPPPVYRKPTRVSKYTSCLEQAMKAHEEALENCPEDTAGVDLAGPIEINGAEGENQ
jgi:hypothetical protein